MTSLTHNPLPFLLAAICLASGLFAAMPSRADDTGVRGTVLWGPVNPGQLDTYSSSTKPGKVSDRAGGRLCRSHAEI